MHALKNVTFWLLAENRGEESEGTIGPVIKSVFNA